MELPKELAQQHPRWEAERIKDCLMEIHRQENANRILAAEVRRLNQDLRVLRYGSPQPRQETLPPERGRTSASPDTSHATVRSCSTSQSLATSGNDTAATSLPGERSGPERSRIDALTAQYIVQIQSLQAQCGEQADQLATAIRERATTEEELKAALADLSMWMQRVLCGRGPVHMSCRLRLLSHREYPSSPRIGARQADECNRHDSDSYSHGIVRVCSGRVSLNITGDDKLLGVAGNTLRRRGSGVDRPPALGAQFDDVSDADCSDEQLDEYYTDLAWSSLNKGCHNSIMTYGQSASGKTYRLTGTDPRRRSCATTRRCSIHSISAGWLAMSRHTLQRDIRGCRASFRQFVNWQSPRPIGGGMLQRRAPRSSKLRRDRA